MVFFSSLFLKTLRLLSLKFKPVGIFFIGKIKLTDTPFAFFLKKKNKKKSVSFFLAGFTVISGLHWVSLGCTGFYWVFTVFYTVELVLTCFIGVSLVLLGFTRFYWVFSRFYQVSLGFYVFLGLTGLYWVLLGFTGFLVGFTRFNWVYMFFLGLY